MPFLHLNLCSPDSSMYACACSFKEQDEKWNALVCNCQLRHIAVGFCFSPPLIQAEDNYGWGSAPALNRRVSDSVVINHTSARMTSPSGRSVFVWAILPFFALLL